jgi:hypothetical protein
MGSGVGFTGTAIAVGSSAAIANGAQQNINRRLLNKHRFGFILVDVLIAGAG